MIFGLLAVLAVVNVLYVLHLERKDGRHDEQVNRLLLLIQAPNVAVAQAQQVDAPPSLPAVNPFDADDYWAAERERDEALRRMTDLEQELG